MQRLDFRLYLSFSSSVFLPDCNLDSSFLVCFDWNLVFFSWALVWFHECLILSPVRLHHIWRLKPGVLLLSACFCADWNIVCSVLDHISERARMRLRRNILKGWFTVGRRLSRMFHWSIEPMQNVLCPLLLSKWCLQIRNFILVLRRREEVRTEMIESLRDASRRWLKEWKVVRHPLSTSSRNKTVCLLAKCAECSACSKQYSFTLLDDHEVLVEQVGECSEKKGFRSWEPF